LQQVSFQIEKNKKIALVGASGSGKSTMCDLIIRLYDPTAGAILLDGVNIRALTFASYRRLFGVVSQESLLFNDSIANNIRFGAKETLSDAQVREAARIANALEFIEKLPNAFDTNIGDRGVLLSGGQKQRLAIARALAGNPAILIFDEATSALDSITEEEITGTIRDISASKQQITILIAHRLSTIMHADRIYVLEQGEVVETGDHQALLEEKGLYYAMWRQQIGERKKLGSTAMAQ